MRSRRVSLLVGGVLLGATTWGQDTGIVEGRVVESGSGRAVAGARVTYPGRGASGSAVRTVVADAAGRFRFDGLPADPIQFRADHPSAPSRSLAPLLTLGPGEHLTGYTVKLELLGSIRGGVRDESGNPIRGCDVSIFSRRRYLDGRDLVDVAREIRTNERGEYEISDLEPGRYLLRFSCSDGMPRASGRVGVTWRYRELYYPSEPGRGSNDAIELREGQALDHVDATVTAEPATTVLLRVPVTTGERLNARLAPASWSGPTRWLLGDAVSMEAGGSGVVSRSLGPGEYLLEGKVEGPGPPRFVHQTMSVNENCPMMPCPATVVTVRLFSGVQLSGRVDWLRDPPRPERPPVVPMPNEIVLDDTPTLGLAVIPLDRAVRPDTLESVQLDDHDEFLLPPLPPGRYLVRFVQAFDDYYYVQSFLQGTRLVDGPIVTVSGDSEEQRVVIVAGWMPELILDGRALSDKNLIAMIPVNEDLRELQTLEELWPRSTAAVRILPGQYRVVVAGYVATDDVLYRWPDEALGQLITVPAEGSATLTLEPSRQLQGAKP